MLTENEEIIRQKAVIICFKDWQVGYQTSLKCKALAMINSDQMADQDLSFARKMCTEPQWS